MFRLGESQEATITSPRTCHPPSLGFHVTQNEEPGPGSPLDTKFHESEIPPGLRVCMSSLRG